ncbi:cellulase family glycosylhydrolase [Pleomorphovibrio marinus]|uniref:cellulase family glycosylhydrolase n=1 Tax=Pleomorphovibrio marinus TaxID=2164132 RepID=UPI000E0BEEB4|nr:cellulase family glycosylhydrolase [Pleomorphovibrio marinus]
MHSIKVIFLLGIILSSIAPPAFAQLAIEGERFKLNQQPFDMWGIRVASASQSDELTEHLIDQLDDYKAHGVNTVTLFLQGSSGAYSEPFRKNGKKVDDSHWTRVEEIVAACEERNMVAIIGIFYQRVMANMSGDLQIKNAKGVENAVKTVAKKLNGNPNVILNIANEHNSSYYKKCEFYDFNDPQNMIDLCRLAKSNAQDLIVGAGGYHDDSNVQIGKSEHVEVLLFDTFDDDVENGQHSKWHYDYFKANGVPDKPIVNVEMFGGWTGKFMPPGVYPPEGQAVHFIDVDEAAEIPGLSVFFHSNPWCQGGKVGTVGGTNRYDLAGDGSAEDPGIRWWFEYVRNIRNQ